MHTTPKRLSVALFSAFALALVCVQAAPTTPAGEPPAVHGGWPGRLVHDWDLLRGRADPLHQSLAAARENVRIAREQSFGPNPGGRYEDYLQRAHVQLHNARRLLDYGWRDPTFVGRLGYLTRAVQGMASGALKQTPALYDRLDWELTRLLNWRWAP